MQWLAVALGGALGAVSRFALVTYLYPVTGERFPLGTLVVNILGCFLVGVCYVLIVERSIWSPELRLWLMTGFLGALTTYSAFSLEAVLLWQNGHGMAALLYVLATLAGCLAATVVAIGFTQRLL